MTVHTFRPLNQSVLEWLRGDRYFRAVSPSDRRLGGLALFLAQLEAHLVLWVAKYEAWIPQHPEHALVFLASSVRLRTCMWFPYPFVELFENSLPLPRRALRHEQKGFIANPVT